MYHGEIVRKVIKAGGRPYIKTIRYCIFHGEIALFTCADWDAKHSKCNQSNERHGAGLELPKMMKKAA